VNAVGVPLTVYCSPFATPPMEMVQLARVKIASVKL